MAPVRRQVGDIWSALLYHYQRFCPAWLATTLSERKVFCANPDTLNDPWDCKPCFSSKTKGGTISMETDGITAAVQAEVAKRRIYCLTPNPLSILMWSHYAADHSGICLEFHTSNLLFEKAQAVIYEPEYAVIHSEHLFSMDTVDKVILTKASCWCYEEEFRLVASPFLPDDEPLKLRDGYLTIPDRCLRSVIVGCKGDHKAVAEVVRKHSPATRVIRIIRAPNEYKLMMAIDRTV